MIIITGAGPAHRKLETGMDALQAVLNRQNRKELFLCGLCGLSPPDTRNCCQTI
jgi:hypothetical protein